MARREEPMSPSAELTLTPSESSRLTELEQVIEAGMKTFAEVGTALWAIRDGRLYRASHATFESYCREKWGFARNYANKMIAAAEVVGRLGTIVPKPSTERQARPLAQLPAAEQPQAWKEATEHAESEGRRVTARDVETVVEERKARAATAAGQKEEPQEPGKRQESEDELADEMPNPAREGKAMYFAAEAVNLLREIKQNDPARIHAFRWVKKWVTDNE
jgi:hypothetical protein